MKALDVANFFIYLMSEKEDKLTNLKINKLLYFAQGHTLKRLSRPLFDDPISAWKYGAVVDNVYHKFKQYKNQPISTIKGDFDIDKFSDEEKDIILDVARVYGQYTGSTLTNMTHKKDTPWSQVYDNHKQGIEIPLASIKEYFDKLDDIAFTLDDIENMEFEGYHDEDGVLVLPEYYEY